MTTHETVKTKDDILKAFKALTRERDGQPTQITTKAEEAERSKEQEVVTRAVGYTVPSIVKGLADLQLSFSDELDGLAETLEKESSKLTELKHALEIEAARLAELKNLRIAAEALALLEREHAEEMAQFEKGAESERKDLEEGVTTTRAQWAKEQADADVAAQEFEAGLKKARAQAEADFKYDQERKRKLEADANEERKRLLERTLSETEAAKAKNWGEREKALGEKEAEIIELRGKVAGFPAETETAVKDAREDGIKKTLQEARVAAQLASKEVEANVQVFELKIKSLEETIEKQGTQIQKLQDQLQVAVQQSQSLAVKAIESASRSQHAAASSV